jgi:hypothetical protein
MQYGSHQYITISCLFINFRQRGKDCPGSNIKMSQEAPEMARILSTYNKKTTTFAPSRTPPPVTATTATAPCTRTPWATRPSRCATAPANCSGFNQMVGRAHPTRLTGTSSDPLRNHRRCEYDPKGRMGHRRSSISNQMVGTAHHH